MLATLDPQDHAACTLSVARVDIQWPLLCVCLVLDDVTGDALGKSRLENHD